MQALTAQGWSPSELKARGMAMRINRVHIQYKVPALWGDTLDMTTFSLELDDAGNSFYIGMTRASDGEPIANCILDWGLSNRDGEERLSLPDSLKEVHRE